MPLDGHAFLVNHGWSGAGNGLRKGAISTPLAIPQKRNLAGIGKDRDEAFPFWDHLFTVAASAIQIECFSSDDDDGDASTKCVHSSTLDLRQTSTGILSNLPPVVGTPITSDDTTPMSGSEAVSGSSTPRLSLMALAKREAARRGLYSKFFRGPVLGPNFQSETLETEATVLSQTLGDSAQVGTEKRSKNKSKAGPSGDSSTEDPNGAMRQKRRREKAERVTKKLHRRKGEEGGEEDVDETVLSAAQKVTEVVTSEAPHEMPHKRKKKNKRKTSELGGSPFERTSVIVDREDSKSNDSKASRKKRRREVYL